VNRAGRRDQITPSIQANQGRLLMLRYERAIGAMAEAGAAFQAGRGVAGVDRVVRADTMIRELADDLAYAPGGALARHLAGLHDYCRRRLAEAAAQRDARRVMEVAGLLDGLLASWRQAPNGAHQPQGALLDDVVVMPSAPRSEAEAQETLRVACALILGRGLERGPTDRAA
jgi:flagellar biosynthetic protein FliS